MQQLSLSLSECKARAVDVKSELVDIQGSLSQHSALANHISEQQKQCSARLSLVKTSGLEIRRTKRDHDELQVCLWQIFILVLV